MWCFQERISRVRYELCCNKVILQRKAWLMFDLIKFMLMKEDKIMMMKIKIFVLVFMLPVFIASCSSDDPFEIPSTNITVGVALIDVPIAAYDTHFYNFVAVEMDRIQ